MNYNHFYTIDGYNGTITFLNEANILENTENIYTECVIINDSTTVNLECFVNSDTDSFILKPLEKLEFEMTIENLVLRNLSATESIDYRVFLKRRVPSFKA